MIRKLAAVMVFAAGAIALSSGAAQADGVTYGHCMDTPAPCVDTTGWGVSIRYADGSQSQNYGPEGYQAKMVDGKLFYTFKADAEPYGDPWFPTFDY